MNVLVFAAGPPPAGICAENLPAGEILCADGGAAYVYRLGLVPRLIVGDFDSLDEKILQELITQGAVIEKHPRHKNKTDLELLLENAMSLNPENIYLWGGIGDRWDHSLANIQLLETYACRGITCRAYTNNTEMIFLQGPKEVMIKNCNSETVSLIPLSRQVKDVNLENFLYPLDNAELHWGSTLSISNRTNSNNCRISFSRGSLLVILPHNNQRKRVQINTPL